MICIPEMSDCGTNECSAWWCRLCLWWQVYFAWIWMMAVVT